MGVEKLTHNLLADMGLYTSYDTSNNLLEATAVADRETLVVNVAAVSPVGVC